MSEGFIDVYLPESTRLKLLLNLASPTPIGVASQENLDCEVVCYATRKRATIGPALMDLLISSAEHRARLVEGLT